jgi:hypothetical protein
LVECGFGFMLEGEQVKHSDESDPPLLERIG